MRLAYFLMFSHLAVYVQYLQLHLRNLGYGNGEVGLLMGLLQISGVAGALLMGAIVDRRPITRTLLSVAIAGSAVLLVVLGFARGLAAAIPITIAIGLLFRSEIPLLDTHVSLVLHDTGHDYGRLRVWGTIGFVAISLGFQFAGYPRPDIDGSIVVTFLAVAAAYLVAVAFLPPARVEARQRSGGRGERLPRAFWLVVAIVFLGNTGFSAHTAFFSLYVQDMLPGFLVSGAWAIGAAAEIPVMLFGGNAIRRVGVRVLLVVATAATAARLLIYALAPRTGPVLAAQLLHALTFGALHVAGMGFVTRAVEPEARGRAVSLYNAFGFGMPGLLGGVLGGQILEYLGFSTLFWVFALPPAAGAVIGIVFGGSIERAVYRNRGPASDASDAASQTDADR